jgi:mannose-6-phosphate isomerase-like protein (cupin superfamily)
VIKGSGIVTIDNETLECFSGRSFYIPRESKHRIECTGNKPLVFVEVQTGEYFGEDDIVRYEDDYDRLR